MDSETPSDLSEKSTLPSAPGVRFNPWLFFGLLVLPGIISTIVLSQYSDDYGMASLITLIAGSIPVGLVCGIHFTLAQRSLSGGVKWVVGIIAVVGCAGSAFALGIGGCYLAAIFFG